MSQQPGHPQQYPGMAYPEPGPPRQYRDAAPPDAAEAESPAGWSAAGDVPAPGRPDGPYGSSAHGGSAHGSSAHGGSAHGGSAHGGSAHGGSAHGGSAYGDRYGESSRAGTYGPDPYGATPYGADPSGGGRHGATPQDTYGTTSENSYNAIPGGSYGTTRHGGYGDDRYGADPYRDGKPGGPSGGGIGAAFGARRAAETPRSDRPRDLSEADQPADRFGAGRFDAEPGAGRHGSGRGEAYSMGRDDPYRSRGGDQDDPYGSSRHGATPFGADRADSRGPDQYASDRFSPDRFSSDRQDPGPHDRDRYGEPAGQPSSGVLPSGGQSNDGTGAAFGAARWGAAGARSARPRDLSDADRFGAEPSGGPFGGGPFGGGQAGARTSDHSFGGDRAGTAPEAPFGAPGRDADETAPMQRITDDTAPGPSFGGKRITDDTAPGGSFGGKGSSRTGAAGAGGDRAGTGVGPTGGRSADAAGIGAPQTGQPAGAAPDRTHRLAVAALVCGVLGLVPLGAIFGLMALSRLRKRPGAGRRLALGGLAFSAAWLAVIVGGTAVMMIFGPEGNTANPSGDNSSVSSFELAPGDCINGLKESRAVAKLPAVPCTKPHEGEVFATFALAKGGTWPGDAAVAKQAENGCVQRLEEYAPKAADDPKLEIYFLHPNDTSWKKGDREVTCVAMDPSKQRTGSLRG